MENDKNEDLKKKVDGAWKESVDKEKSSGGAEADSSRIPEASFGLFIYGLMMEAMIAFGEAENPLTKKKEMNTPHAKFLIDTLDMLKSKTKGNLTKDEEDMLEGILYELRMRFVRKSDTPKPKI